MNGKKAKMKNGKKKNGKQEPLNLIFNFSFNATVADFEVIFIENR